MKKIIYLALLVIGFWSLPSHAQTIYGSFQNNCEVGGQSALVQGLKSTNKLQGSWPGCLVTVYQHRTITRIPIFSDSGATVLSNPFTASSITGNFIFYWSSVNVPVDVVISPNPIFPATSTMPTFTYSNVSFGSGGGGGVVSINGVPGAFTFQGAGVSCVSTVCTFTGGANIGNFAETFTNVRELLIPQTTHLLPNSNIIVQCTDPAGNGIGLPHDVNPTSALVTIGPFAQLQSGKCVLSGSSGASSTVEFNLVGAGDSRMAGTTLPAGDDLLTQISLQPQFAGKYSTLHNGAVGGDTCALMTSRYAANVFPYRPSGSVTTAYLFMLEGHNDFATGVSLISYEACYSAYVVQAVADGFTPILITSYYSSALTMTQDAERQLANNWIRSLPYLVIDSDLFFPPNTVDPWKVGGDQGGSTTLGVMSYSIISGTAIFPVTNSLSVGQLMDFSQFTGSSSFLNYQQPLPVTAASGTSFSVTIPYPDVATTIASGSAITVLPTPDPTHLGIQGVALLAKAVNFTYGLQKSGTTMPQVSGRDIMNAPSGAFRENGCLQAGNTTDTCNFGAVYSSATPTIGALFLGGDASAGLIREGTGGLILSMGTEGGGLTTVNGTEGLAWSGGSLAGCAPGVTCSADNLGNLYSYGGVSSGGAAFGTDGAWTLSRTGGTTTWTTPSTVTLNNGFSATAFAVSGTLGISKTVTITCGTLTFTSGLLTSTTCP